MDQKTEMRVLLYSSVLYLLGITVVLYLRPKLMFRHDGRWKEFGVNGVDTTYFPFWLFCIVWAVTAYAIIRVLYSDSSETAVVAPTNIVKNSSISEPLAPLPVPTTGPVESESPQEGKPGYYKLDKAVMKEKGTPLYVYIGPEKPAELE